MRRKEKLQAEILSFDHQLQVDEERALEIDESIEQIRSQLQSLPQSQPGPIHFDITDSANAARERDQAMARIQELQKSMAQFRMVYDGLSPELQAHINRQHHAVVVGEANHDQLLAEAESWEVLLDLVLVEARQLGVGALLGASGLLLLLLVILFGVVGSLPLLRDIF